MNAKISVFLKWVQTTPPVVTFSVVYFYYKTFPMYKNSEGLRVLFKFYEEEQKQQTHITEQNFLTFCLELSL